MLYNHAMLHHLFYCCLGMLCSYCSILGKKINSLLTLALAIMSVVRITINLSMNTPVIAWLDHFLRQ